MAGRDDNGVEATHELVVPGRMVGLDAVGDVEGVQTHAESIDIVFLEAQVNTCTDILSIHLELVGQLGRPGEGITYRLDIQSDDGDRIPDLAIFLYTDGFWGDVYGAGVSIETNELVLAHPEAPTSTVSLQIPMSNEVVRLSLDARALTAVLPISALDSTSDIRVSAQADGPEAFDTAVEFLVPMIP